MPATKEKHLLNSGSVWLVVFEDDTAARWRPVVGRLTAPTPLQSLLAHCHVNEPWEVVAVDGPSVPEALRRLLDQGSP